MMLLLVRHAHAGERDGSRWPDDTQRPLSRRGRESARRMARRLRAMGLRPTLILASPWRRAWQSAELLAEGAAPRIPPIALGALAMTPAIAPIARAIGPQDPAAIVALVGHEPWMSQLAGLLLTGRRDGLDIDFPKGGVLGLGAEDLRSGTAHLRLFLRPKLDA
ncbi:MAG TPA: histidine phosphatase family protein [Gemmatimonadales bacterium]|nr:histidine phosphatase family protein [Gemmatimonadales bacterium]